MGLAVVLAPAGEFMFFHHRLLQAESGWQQLSRFRWLLTNGYATFPPEKVALLHRHGSRLFFYFWFNGFYEWEARQSMPDGDWRREILERHRDWLLNPEQGEQGGGATAPAYFFDFTRPELRQFLAYTLAAHRRRTGYDGVFFDYAGSYPLPPAIARRHQERHPEIPYDAAGALFLQAVRAMDPRLLIFTNQAYRAAEHLLPYTDLDVAESLATSWLGGREVELFAEGEGWIRTCETFYRPWEGIQAYYTDILAKVRRFNPRVRFLTINYLKAFWEPTGATVIREGRAYPVYRRRPDRAAAFYGYVAAKLFGLDSYSSDWYDLGSGEDEVFLTRLGRPQGDGPELQGSLVVRYFERGLVALTATEQGGRATLPPQRLPEGLKGLRDLYERRTIPASRKQCRLEIPPTVSPVSGSTYPAGRVYRYIRP